MQVRIRISRPSTRRPDLPEAAVLPATPSAAAGESIRRPRTSFALGASSRVALGILVSRITGLIRERAVGHYFGASLVADAFRAAIRIPNLLNNLFGEGVLSASFVTVYSKLRALGKEEEAQHLAAAVLGLLTLLCSGLVLIGVIFTPLLIDVIAPGFAGEKRQLTVHIVRILFPGTGLLVMSAWCLGVLNSHRHFLLSYMAPVAMNFTMIATLLAFGGSTAQEQLVLYLAWGSVLGSALQFLLQLPRVLQILPALRPTLDINSEHVRSVIRNFGPIFLSRGVVQISAYIDSMIASFLPTGSLANLGYGQIIAALPISLFSMSISAAELPGMSSAVGTPEEIAAFLRQRLNAGLRRIAFFVVPSAAAFLVLGDVVAGALYQTGRFVHTDTLYVWAVLAGSSIGLLASSLGRLYSSAFYSLLDTKTPLRFALIRVTLTTALGLLFALPLPRWLHINQEWGIAGLTASAGISGWVEFTLLRHALGRKIGKTPLTVALLGKLWAVALLAASVGFFMKSGLGPFGTRHPLPLAAIVLSLFGVLYFAGTYALGVEECRGTLNALRRRIGI